MLGTPLPAAVDSLLVDVVEPLLTPSILILFGEAVAERRLRDVGERDVGARDVGERCRREMSPRCDREGAERGTGRALPLDPPACPPLGFSISLGLLKQLQFSSESARGSREVAERSPGLAFAP